VGKGADEWRERLWETRTGWVREWGTCRSCATVLVRVRRSNPPPPCFCSATAIETLRAGLAAFSANTVSLQGMPGEGQEAFLYRHLTGKASSDGLHHFAFQRIPSLRRKCSS